ncbi:DUF6479 family protein [Streptomyces sp. NPDC051569]|uniref:DUF6479 family protein n=1 Tax=Streptomyces sp. NPDC051569 TaxID=3365661 RepID=UPI0037983CA5
MNPLNTYHGGGAVHLAASGVGTDVIAFIVGLIIVAALIGGFILGGRLRAKRAAPPTPEEQPHRPERTTHIEENVEPSDKFLPGGERLMPYQLGGHGDEAFQPPEEPESRAGLGDGDDEPPARPGGGSHPA